MGARRTMRKALILTSMVVGCTASTACSRRLLSVAFDLPRAEKPAPPVTTSSPASGGAAPDGAVVVPDLLSAWLAPEDTVVPPAEQTLDPDSVIRLLPRDHAGNIDWVAAWRSGIIKPRNGPGGPRERPEFAFDFKFDFYFEGPNETFDAYFPHSVHTEQIDCLQCHPRIFKKRGVTFAMADVLGGRYCGECHGTVAFNPPSACERCHTAMQMPADRAKPELTGTVQMKRVTEILGDSVTVAGNAAGVRTDNFPRARFPHWVHRIRFQCRTCHMEIFVPEAGANAVTMADINAGKFCGKCHNGQTAFIPSMTNCARCHPADPGAAVAPPDGGGGP